MKSKKKRKEYALSLGNRNRRLNRTVKPSNGLGISPPPPPPPPPVVPFLIIDVDSNDENNGFLWLDDEESAIPL